MWKEVRFEGDNRVLFGSWSGMWSGTWAFRSLKYCRYESKRLCVCRYWILREAVSCVQSLELGVGGVKKRGTA